MSCREARCPSCSGPGVSSKRPRARHYDRPGGRESSQPSSQPSSSPSLPGTSQCSGGRCGGGDAEDGNQAKKANESESGKQDKGPGLLARFFRGLFGIFG